MAKAARRVLALGALEDEDAGRAAGRGGPRIQRQHHHRHHGRGRRLGEARSDLTSKKKEKKTTTSAREDDCTRKTSTLLPLPA